MKTTRLPFVLFASFLMATLLLLSVGELTAQTNAGKDFWVVQTPNGKSAKTDTAQFAIGISNLGSSPATVTITNPVKPSVTKIINPGALEMFFFPTENPNILPAVSPNGNNVVTNIYNNNVYHVTSLQNVIVYSFNPFYNVITNDAALVLPTHALGKHYRTVSYIHPLGGSGNSYFSVVASQNGTSVKTYNRSGVLKDDVIVNEGQCFQRLNGNSLSADMTGWYIEADKPVGVLSGTQFSGVGNTTGASDHLDEQLVPIESLAKTYIASPTNARPLGCVYGNCAQDVFRYVATEDNTVITTTPNVGGGTINKGQYIEITTATPHVVTGTSPFYGFQYLVSQNSGTPTAAGIGDPSLMSMPVVDQFQYRYGYIIPSSFPSNFINIVAPQGSKINLDGSIISPNWIVAGTVNGTMYLSATYPTSQGVHEISADKKFGLVVTGVGPVASYGYMGGSGLQPINAGCISGGPYQALTCSSGAVSIQLRGTPTCGDSSAPKIQWTSEGNSVTFSDSSIVNPVATVAGAGIYTVTLSVNCGGNITSCSTEIIVRDPVEGCANVTAPSLTPPPPIIIPSDDNSVYATLVNLEQSGNVSYTATGPVTIINNAPANFPLGTTNVIWTLTDGNGITTSGRQTVTVVPPPSIVAPNDTTFVNNAGESFATTNNIGSPVSYWVYNNYSAPVNTGNAAGNYNIGSTAVVWSITDQWGRVAMDTQYITVTSAPPTIIAPAPITVIAGYNGIASIASLGTATTTVSVNPATVSNDGLSQYPIGSTTVTWTVTDGLNRTASDVQQIIVVAPRPLITPPADITISNDPGVNYSSNVVLVDPVFSAVGPYTLTNDAPASGQFPIGPTVVKWTLTDAYGNSVTTSNKVTVVSAPPTIVAPPTITVTAGYNGFGSVASLGTPTTTVSVNPATVTNAGTLAQYPIGSTNVTWTVTDGLGRTASDVQQVVVIAPRPVIAPPADITISNDPGVTYSSNVVLVNPVFSAVGPFTLTNDAPANGHFPIGTTVVTWTLTDAYGNIVTTTNKVTVVSAPPTIVAPAPITVTAGYNGFASIANLGTPTTSVSVNPATVTNAGSLAQYPIGSTIITWTVKDGLGRTASDVQKVFVVAPRPVIAPPADVTVSNDPGKTYATGVNLGTPTVQAVGPYTLTNDAPANGQWPLGTTSITWTLTDAYGNVVKTTQKVTVVSAPPTLTPPANITVTAAAGQTSATIATIGTATYTVSVNPATLTNSGNASGVYPVGTTTVTWTVKDGLGRTASGTQTITVNPPASCSFVSSVTSVPTDVTPTGGNPKNLYIGYGAQSTKLQVNVPNTGGPYTFQWTGTKLSSNTSAAPIFTPGTAAGNYSFTVAVKNASGCTSTATISICVRDVRSLDKNGNWDGKKVIVCHLPPGNIPNVQYIDVSINAVPTHVPNHGGDGLGNTCEQPSCTSPYARGTAPVVATFGVSLYPNPSANQFSLTVKSDDKYTDINIRIIDAFGRTVEVFKSVTAGRTVLFGDKYANGSYFAEVVQGSDKKMIPMVKAK
jgi:hypothetical protein